MSATVAEHYHQQLQTDQIISKLQEAYPQGPTLFQLAPVDQLHIGGIKASMKLLKRLEALNATSVLDIGSGLGGLMRLAFAQCGIKLIGLDITHPLNHINRKLSALCDPESTPSVITGDAHHLPLPDETFDVVLFQHSLLNMPDARQVLSEARRVLKTGGIVLMHEVLQGPSHSEMSYPVPWARTDAHSHLQTQATLEALLQACGFTQTELHDWSQEALTWRQRQSEKEHQSNQATQKPPVSPALILGPEFAKMGKNVMDNLQSNAARVVEVVGKKADLLS